MVDEHLLRDESHHSERESNYAASSAAVTEADAANPGENRSHFNGDDNDSEMDIEPDYDNYDAVRGDNVIDFEGSIYSPTVYDSAPTPPHEPLPLPPLSINDEIPSAYPQSHDDQGVVEGNVEVYVENAPEQQINQPETGPEHALDKDSVYDYDSQQEEIYFSEYEGDEPVPHRERGFVNEQEDEEQAERYPEWHPGGIEIPGEPLNYHLDDPDDIDRIPAWLDAVHDATEGGEYNTDFYKKIKRELDEKELLSIAYFDIIMENSVTRDGDVAIREFIAISGGKKPWEGRTTLPKLEKWTGITRVEFDCCVNSCLCYTGEHALRERCIHCNHPRWREVTINSNATRQRLGRNLPEDEVRKKRTAFKKYVYIPLIPRLRLQLSNKEFAQLLIDYRKEIEAKGDGDGVLYDYWNAATYKQLKKEGLFSADSDIGFFFSADGVKIFKERSPFKSYPIVLFNLNLPPTIRVKLENILVCGHVPGPKEPKDLDSFLWPLREEFVALQDGVKAYNAALDSVITLRAHICIVGADSRGREKLLHAGGTGAYRYCPYCYAIGVWNKAVYCPFTLPKYGEDPVEATLQNPNTAPARKRDIQELRHNQRDWDPAKLLLRKDQEWRDNTAHMQSFPEDKAYKQFSGVGAESVFHDLVAFLYNSCCTIDAMHEFFELIAPNEFNHMRGRFETGKKANRQEDGSTKGRNSHFADSGDAYCLQEDDWHAIGSDMEASANTFPEPFGDRIKRIDKHYYLYRARDWQSWMELLSPIFLKDRLPERDYEYHCLLSEAIQLACNPQVSLKDIKIIRENLLQYVGYYEEDVYQYEWDRLKTMTSPYHYLAHIADMVSNLGPMRHYWQYPMERVVGMLVKWCRNRYEANTNLANVIYKREMMNHLRFIVDLPPNHTDVSIRQIIYQTIHKLRQEDAVANLDNLSVLEDGEEEMLAADFEDHEWSRLRYTRHRAEQDAIAAAGAGDLVATASAEASAEAAGTMSRRQQGPCNSFTICNDDMAVIHDYYETTHGFIPDIDDQIQTFSRFALPDGNVLRSSRYEDEQPSIKRKHCFVRCECEMLVNDEVVRLSRYGQVSNLFTLSLRLDDAPDEPKLEHFAWVDWWNVDGDGRLLYIVEGRKEGIVLLEDIKELVGVIISKGRQYIITQRDCFLNY